MLSADQSVGVWNCGCFLHKYLRSSHSKFLEKLLCSSFFRSLSPVVSQILRVQLDFCNCAKLPISHCNFLFFLLSQQITCIYCTVQTGEISQECFGCSALTTKLYFSLDFCFGFMFCGNRTRLLLLLLLLLFFYYYYLLFVTKGVL